MDGLLLDDEPLSGPVGVTRWLSTSRRVHLVAQTSLDDAMNALGAVCNIWGGAYDLLVPLPDEARSIPEPWSTLVADSRAVATAVRGQLPVPLRGEHPAVGGTWNEAIHGELPLSVLAREKGHRTDRRTVRTANQHDMSDPWAVAYAGVFGRLPTVIDQQRLRFAGLRQGLTYTDLIPVDSSAPVDPGAEDLLATLRESDVMTAAQLSCIRLASSAAPRGSQFGVEPDFPLRFHQARECGPNLVVVYEPGSVRDLCLLWHLRAVHGLPRGFPLGVPVTSDVPNVLKMWTNQRAMSVGGFRQPTCYLTSATVAVDELERLAESTGAPWSVVPWVDTLQPSGGCGVSSSEVAVFEQGRAVLSAVHPTEEAAIGREVFKDQGGALDLIVAPVGAALPPSKTLSSAGFTPYREGAVLGLGIDRRTVRLEWPTGLTVLEAVLRDCEVRGTPSEPGRMAETLLRQTNDIGGIRPLMLPAVHELLAQLGERHGMNWFKKLAREVLGLPAGASASLEERLTSIEDRVRELADHPNDADASDITFENVRRVFGERDVAAAWLRWADEAGLVLRGVQVQCDYCTSRSWRALRELAPPVVCRGCGNSIERPYEFDIITFRYRASELLLRLLKTDAIVHALTLRYFSELFSPASDRVGPIYGGYPGVTIRRQGTRDALGEADVMFVMRDGRIGIGECKTRAAGLTTSELEKLATLADVLDASWTFVATLDRAATCGEVWRSAPTSNVPHFALTAEHLYELAPFNSLSNEPFAWRTSYVGRNSKGAASDDQHYSEMVDALRRLESSRNQRNVPWWRAAE
jgi:hypothetical protein